ncbi:hsp90 co-chaperone Cdc37 [Exophiala xenobiotica]|uniref:Hsp90 chaperone protein kinase-targeting subunit n=1 Tax=Lithohypha guttulata TaxID=1690604 RepID=A0ABR0K974_9EURO|nr:hsp90 co-chaperone Cdc37 [Lithohypha guttulata]KAK5327891.1 hsp90 co-chaperone Cdc37 [Exophiala xenobiotica]
MPVDYSKWDALELSDDSDIEVHPNVDKKSFIRAKQNQIHQQRFERRREIDTLKYERIINDGLLERINALLDALSKHQDDARSKDPDQLVFQSLIESAADPAKDEPPKPPEGVYTHQKEQPAYSNMMASLIDQVKKEVDEKKSSDRFKDYMDGVRGHLTKVQNLQQELLTKLAQLEREESSRITSDQLHEGVNYSSVSKSKPKDRDTASQSKPQKMPAEPELLNAKSVAGLASNQRDTIQRSDSQVSSGAEADVEDDSLITKQEEIDEDNLDLTPEATQFSKIKIGDFQASLQFIGRNYDEIMNQKTQDSLLGEAFSAQMKGQQAYAKQCVHQALLVQYCRQLGKDGVGVFLKRVTTKGHQAHRVFVDDVNDTYARIRTRTAELKKQEQEAEEKGDVEQIQLHAVEPGTEIHINVPQPNSSDPTEIEARKIFESFPPGLQRALESGSLDKVNDVLGKMAVDEAEQVVEKLGDGGMLSLQEGVIDATNEEGQQRLREIEEEERRKRELGGEPGDAVPERKPEASVASAAPIQESSAYDID